MWYNAIVAAVLRSPLHSLLGKSTLLLSYRGHNTGKRYTIPVNFVQEGNVLLVTSFRSRTWWRNLRGGASLTVRLHGRDWPTTAEVLEAQDAVATALGRYLQSVPQYAKYLGVHLEGDGKPDTTDLDKAAQQRVVIQINLPPSPMGNTG